jgi:hypothetical protein
VKSSCRRDPAADDGCARLPVKRHLPGAGFGRLYPATAAEARDRRAGHGKSRARHERYTAGEATRGIAPAWIVTIKGIYAEWYG